MSEEVTILHKQARQIRCRRCGHSWFYTGTNQFVCSCPHCKTTITIRYKQHLKNKEDGGDPI
jgi:phage FluMu protein Com